MRVETDQANALAAEVATSVARLVDQLLQDREANKAGSGKAVWNALQSGAAVGVHLVLGLDGLASLQMDLLTPDNEPLRLCDTRRCGSH